ncbi:MAG TPA: hypothetical protein ENL07_00910 [Chlorobaculum parvum]|uniref:Uncharacterized protein n=1 Tax=Chlorobaculum parvum TaxID=274539 RepID=A0A7C5HAW4_9CHLB|nr:hypothetical protein [Chlorobaculum parvum]
MTPNESNRQEPEMIATIGKVMLEKLDSLASKIRDDVATEADRTNHDLLSEIAALASNRLSVEKNESIVEEGGEAWTERTSESHYPHIRLHGGALEDDPPKLNL